MKLFLPLLLLMPTVTWASGIQLGEPLPQLTIDERGELLLEDGDFRFQPWQSTGAQGKVHVLQYLAATRSARDMSKPFTDRLEQSIPYGGYHVTTVINLDDALWGTGGFVVGELKSNKEKYPLSTIVLDEDGAGRDTWRLQPKNSAIIVTDAGGSVLYLKEGAMSEAEIESTLELIRQQIAGNSQ